MRGRAGTGNSIRAPGTELSPAVGFWSCPTSTCHIGRIAPLRPTFRTLAREGSVPESAPSSGYWARGRGWRWRRRGGDRVKRCSSRMVSRTRRFLRLNGSAEGFWQQPTVRVPCILVGAEMAGMPIPFQAASLRSVATGERRGPGCRWKNAVQRDGLRRKRGCPVRCGNWGKRAPSNTSVAHQFPPVKPPPGPDWPPAASILE